MKTNVAGFNDKKSKITLNYDLNTTAEFGVIQPVLCEEVIAKGSYNFNAHSLVQVAPLLSPLFGRISLRSFTSFVPMTDIFHHYDELLTHRKVTHGDYSAYVTSVPTVGYRQLLALLFSQSCVGTCLSNDGLPFDSFESTFWNYFNVLGTSGADSGFKTIKAVAPNSTPSDLDLDSTWMYNYYNCAKVSGSDYDFNYVENTNKSLVTFDVNSNYKERYGAMPTFENADYVLSKRVTVGAAADRYDRSYCIRLSRRARHLRSVYLGLGLNIDVEALMYSTHPLYNKQISILPFLAYYKAWFDIMYPKRDINFANTNAGKLITWLDSTSFSGDIYHEADAFDLFKAFMADVANMVYVYENDYFTAHISSLGNDTENGQFYPGDGVYDKVDADNTTQPAKLNTDEASVTSAGLKLLSAVNNHLLSGTFIGKRVNDYLKQFGVFKNDEESNFIASNILDVDTGTVMSTVENENMFLGQKGGHAEGRSDSDKNKQNQDSWSFTPTVPGFIVRFICIVPKGGFSQGIDPKFFRQTRYSFFNQQFDGIGYNITPYYNFFSSNAVGISENNTVPSWKTGIGYIGRYSDYKYKTNISNGDFSRRPTKTSIGSYYLDKRFPENEIVTIGNQKVTSRADVPIPNAAVRFCNNEYFDFNRVFTSRDDIDYTKYVRRFFDPTDDHFIINQFNEFVGYLPCLPISDAQGATDFIGEQESVSNAVEIS